MILLEVHDGLFDDPFQVESRSAAHSWRMLTPCDDDVRDAADLGEVATVCPLFAESLEAGPAHHDVFLSVMDIVIRCAASGLPWDELMTHKQLHDLGDITVRRASGRDERFKIWQFSKGRTLVRVTWFYTRQAKLMLLTHMFIKPGGSKPTPEREKTRAARVLQTYVEAVDATSARLITAQGGRNGFLKLVG